MKSVEVKIDADDIGDGLAPCWRWRVLIDGTLRAEGLEPFVWIATAQANRALTSAL